MSEISEDENDEEYEHYKEDEADFSNEDEADFYEEIDDDQVQPLSFSSETCATSHLLTSETCATLTFSHLSHICNLSLSRNLFSVYFFPQNLFLSKMLPGKWRIL